MRGLGNVRAIAAGFLITAGLSLAAFDAQAVRYDNIEVKVTPSTPSLSPGKLGTYTFYVANFTNGTINNLRFRAYLDAGEFATNNPISSGAPATCSRVTPQEIDCAITGGILPTGFSTFDFAFTAPTSGSAVSLSWNVRFGQGAATNYIVSNPSDNNPAPISLLADSTKEVKAYVPPGGDYVYTGALAVPTTSDAFTVGVDVNPAGNKVVTAGIFEQSCSQPTRKCAQLEVLRKEVVESGPLAGSLEFFRAVYTSDDTTDLDARLVIKLRFDKSYVAGRPLSQLYIFYTPDGEPNSIQLEVCPKRQPDYVPPVGEPPCIASKFEYTKRNAPDPSLIGVVEAVLWASKNGFVDAGW